MIYDVAIVGAGISGSFIAYSLSAQGIHCVVLEAGKSFNRHSYPRTEVDANAQLYWGGGIELNRDATLGLLRPKVVGGGSIVNQALIDRFDEDAFDDWRRVSQVDLLTREHFDPWYDKAAAELSIQEIPERYHNDNANVFKRGCEQNGYRWSPLRRAQKDCRYEDGNDCIECLAGCRIDSKQSMPVTVLRKARMAGIELISETEVRHIAVANGEVEIVTADGREFRSKKLVLASGAIGNSRLLLRSGFAKKIPAIGHGFYCHPQFMNLAIYKEPLNAHKGAFQTVKSDDPNFRRQGFKLENVFMPPGAIAMMVPGYGAVHHTIMQKVTHMACAEVAIRDTNPGRIRIDKRGRAVIDKRLNREDKKRLRLGMEAIHNIFSSTGAEQIVDGAFGIGLHLMGGCAIGTDDTRSVVSPQFHLHGYDNIYSADSSIFPSAPGINPSFTIMAFSLQAAQRIAEDFRL